MFTLKITYRYQTRRETARAYTSYSCIFRSLRFGHFSTGEPEEQQELVIWEPDSENSIQLFHHLLMHCLLTYDNGVRVRVTKRTSCRCCERSERRVLGYLISLFTDHHLADVPRIHANLIKYFRRGCWKCAPPEIRCKYWYKYLVKYYPKMQRNAG